MLKKIIKEHYKKVEALNEYSVVGAFLYGYNNYVIDEAESSKVKTIVVVIPSLKYVLSKESFEPRYINDGSHIIEIIDLESIFKLWMSGDPNYIEVLFTDYRYVNPQYSTLIGELFSIREDVACYNKPNMAELTYHHAEKLKVQFLESCTDNSYDSSCLYYIAHLFYSMKNFCEKNRTFEQSMLEIPETLKYLYTSQNLDGSAMGKDEVEYKINYYCNVIKLAKEDLSSLQFKDFKIDESIYENTFNVVADIIQYGLTNILSGNSEEIKKLNTLVIAANRVAEDKEKKIKELVEKHKKEFEVNNEKWKEELQNINEQNNIAIKEKNEVIESTREIWVKKVISLKQDQETLINKLKSDFEKDLEKQKNSLSDTIAQMQTDFDKKKQDLEKEFEERYLESEATVQKIKEEAKFQVENAAKINKNIVDSLSEDYKAQLAARDTKINELLENKSQELESLAEKYEANIKELTTKNEAQPSIKEKSDAYESTIKEKEDTIEQLHKKIENQRKEINRLSQKIKEKDVTPEENNEKTTVLEDTQVTEDIDNSVISQELPRPKKKHWWNFD